MLKHLTKIFLLFVPIVILLCCEAISQKQGYFISSSSSNLEGFMAKDGEAEKLELYTIKTDNFKTSLPTTWEKKVLDNNLFIAVDTSDLSEDNIVISINDTDCTDSIIFKLKEEIIGANDNLELVQIQNEKFIEYGKQVFYQRSVIRTKEERYRHDCYFTCSNQNQVISSCLTYPMNDSLNKKGVLDLVSGLLVRNME